LTKGNARFPILEITAAILVSRKSALTFTLFILTSHDENLLINQVRRAIYADKNKLQLMQQPKASIREE